MSARRHFVYDAWNTVRRPRWIDDFLACAVYSSGRLDETAAQVADEFDSAQWRRGYAGRPLLWEEREASAWEHDFFLGARDLSQLAPFPGSL